MPKRNRGYKKGRAHRDARLFVIVAEGVREDEYFAWFNEQNQRIRVKLIDRVENRSAPSHFLERIELFIKETGWSPNENDQLWLVLDVDKWQRESITTLEIAVQGSPNWFIAISNPCFEVWLHYHLAAVISLELDSCTKLKQHLHEVTHTGYKVEDFGPLLKIACLNASNADASNGNYPDFLQTKVYRLGKEMLTVLGNTFPQHPYK